MTLVERLCAATGSDEILDGEIWKAAIGKPHDVWATDEDGVLMLQDPEDTIAYGRAPRYTASLDAAMTLVPDGHEWLRKDPGVMTVYRVPTDDKEWARHIEAAGATPALALCIASLRARESA